MPRKLCSVMTRRQLVRVGRDQEVQPNRLLVAQLVNQVESLVVVGLQTPQLRRGHRQGMPLVGAALAIGRLSCARKGYPELLPPNPWC